jgi:4-diphosphocytidyl-2-C-methyl-D-erythritol kinase
VTGPCWPAPAKLNLFLHVVGRRPDGYHLLQTVFQFLDYCDRIEFRDTADGRIRRIGGHRDIAEADDLVVRAARALQAETGTGRGTEIRLDKRIPAGGGLGGGSSDAATTLVALNAIWDLGLDCERLAAIGLSLGADVPVFVRGRAAWAEGVGERLTPVEVPEDWYLVVHPGTAVSTAEIFGHADLTRNSPAITIRDFLAGAGTNDCEPVVRTLRPEVAAALDWLRQRGDARMTGTGSCIFLRFHSPGEAGALLADLPAGWSGFVAQGRNRSPLLDRLEQFAGA